MVKIKRIYIKNFRSIVEADIDVSEFNVFVGLNDSGKSNVLKALNLFFNYKRETFNFFEDYSKLVHYTGHRAKEIIIALTLEIPKPYTDAGEIVWTKRWTNQPVPKDFLSSFSREFSSKARTAVLLDRISYEYIPAVKSKEYFKDLLAEMYETMLTVANSELREVNQLYSDKLKQLTNDLSTIIKNTLKIDSYIKMPENLAALFRDLLFETKNEEKESIDLAARGDGIQARHIPAILKFIYDKKIIEVKRKSVPCTVIWGYEEPENGIEMAACFALARELISYSNDIQMFITSHSPAFYSATTFENTKVYVTYKNSGKTNYKPSTDSSVIDEHIGLMPIIQPYITDVINKYEEKQKTIIDVKNELIDSLKQQVIEEKNLVMEGEHRLQQEKKGKIILITEGKSDINHIHTAFNSLQGLDEAILNRIEYYDFTKKETLGDQIKDVLNYLVATPIKGIVIGIFDRDKVIITCERGKNYCHQGKSVFKFNIPALSNAERKIDDKICIEHYYSNSEIKTEMESGHLYLGEDFNEFGTSLDGDWSFTGFRLNNAITKISIIDRNNTHVERKSAQGKMATKMEYSSYVMNHPDQFNFENFRKIFEVIKEIVDDCERPQNTP